MYRRAVGSFITAIGNSAFARRFLTLDSGKRDELTERLVSLKEECHGQGLDLADMNDAVKQAGRDVQDKVKQLNIDDAQFKGKVLTLSASVKAYNTRLCNLQTEAKSIQAEVEALLKLMWGTESPEAATFSTPPSSASNKAAAKEMQDEFEVEPPPIAQMVDDINNNSKTTTAAEKVERVDGEHLPSDAPLKSSSTTTKEEEIEVETIEIEVEPKEQAGSSSSASSDPAASAVDNMKITDITTDLYERGINFSDCLDAKSLRQRYKDVLAGKFATPVSAKPPQQNTNQPPMPRRPEPQQQNYSSSGSNPNTTQGGLATDPYPNAQRKMVDPMRYVEDVKKELCAEQGIDPNSVDLWSGKVRLEDKKRLYDYPTVQSYPIEVRQKGDIPR